MVSLHIPATIYNYMDVGGGGGGSSRAGDCIDDFGLSIDDFGLMRYRVNGQVVVPLFRFGVSGFAIRVWGSVCGMNRRQTSG